MPEAEEFTIEAVDDEDAKALMIAKLATERISEAEQNRRLQGAERARAIRQVLTHHSIADVSRYLGISRQAIYNILDQFP